MPCPVCGMTAGHDPAWHVTAAYYPDLRTWASRYVFIAIVTYRAWHPVQAPVPPAAKT